ncbi:MAG: hypothetical protein JW901_05430 [Dehalococcoidia bacterium]|nr:hypothetical protein [Dehalococcoidia bacterium]
MTYKDKELQKKTTRERVRRYRNKQKPDVTKGVTCLTCGGKGYIEERGGLIMRGCPDCKGK